MTGAQLLDHVVLAVIDDRPTVRLPKQPPEVHEAALEELSRRYRVALESPGGDAEEAERLRSLTIARLSELAVAHEATLGQRFNRVARAEAIAELRSLVDLVDPETLPGSTSLLSLITLLGQIGKQLEACRMSGITTLGELQAALRGEP